MERAFSPDSSRIVSGGSDGTIRLWALDGKSAAEPFAGLTGVVRSVAFSPDGTRVISAGADADTTAFMNAKNDDTIDSAAVIEMLVDCGLLNRNVTNRRLQFAYDPVAEHLAARLAAQGAPGAGIAPLKERILSEPGSVIARVMTEIESSLRPQPSEPQPARKWCVRSAPCYPPDTPVFSPASPKKRPCSAS